jgi:hypothetical protein
MANAIAVGVREYIWIPEGTNKELMGIIAYTHAVVECTPLSVDDHATSVGHCRGVTELSDIGNILKVGTISACTKDSAAQASSSLICT